MQNCYECKHYSSDGHLHTGVCDLTDEHPEITEFPNVPIPSWCPLIKKEEQQ